MAHGGQRGGQGNARTARQQRGGGDLRAPRASPHREGDSRPQARGHGRVQAGEVARAQARHGAAQRQAGDEPQPERSSPPRPARSSPRQAPQRQGDGERGQRGDGLEADPRAEVGVGREQAQRPGRGGRRASAAACSRARRASATLRPASMRPARAGRRRCAVDAVLPGSSRSIPS